jgi:uncharacterized membrane protein YuzA (DUF378 family)
VILWIRRFTMKALSVLACILVLVGALNWGLVGATGFGDGKPFNLVEKLTDKVAGDKVEADGPLSGVADAVNDAMADASPGQNWLENVVYLLVGLSAVFLILTKCCGCGCCSTEKPKEGAACCAADAPAEAPAE